MISPEFIIFTGPMFSSKTTKLLAVVDRYIYQKKAVLAFKPKLDDRYSSGEISTHNGGRLKAVTVNTGLEVEKHVLGADENVNVVAVDEAFMIDDIASSLIKLFKMGKTIVVSSLQLSASCNVFEEVRDMMPFATKIEVCPAVCPITGQNAYYTHRKHDNIGEIAVGGAELYEPRCWEYHSHMNKLE